MQRMEASGTLNQDLDKSVYGDAQTRRKGAPVAPSTLTVIVDGTATPVNQVARKQYAAYVGGRALPPIDLTIFIGQRVLTQLADQYNGTLELKSI
jgi:hypothetical protein